MIKYEVAVPGLVLDGGALALGTGGELTIAGGAVTVTSGYHTVDTEGGAASDDLETVVGSAIRAGGLLLLRPDNGGRTVIARNDTASTPRQNRLQLADGLDHTMDTAESTLLLMRVSNYWVEVARAPSTLTADKIRERLTGLTGAGRLDVSALKGYDSLTDIRRDRAGDLSGTDLDSAITHNVQGVCAGVTTLWVLDTNFAVHNLRAFDIGTSGGLTRNASKDISVGAPAAGKHAAACTCNGTHIWVAYRDGSTNKAMAFAASTRSRAESHDFTFVHPYPGSGQAITGMCSTSDKMWVNAGAAGFFVYSLPPADPARPGSAQADDLPLAGSGHVFGLATDGDTIWAAGHSAANGTRDARTLRAYDVSRGDFDDERSVFVTGVANKLHGVVYHASATAKRLYVLGTAQSDGMKCYRVRRAMVLLSDV